MNTEIEAKFTQVDPADIRVRLARIGAVLQQPERLMRRKNFDYPDHQLESKAGWVRVRDEGDRVTLAYKQLLDRTLHGTKEVSITVDSFDTTVTLLTAIGLVTTSYQETKRESWLLNDTQIEIDTWPWIPSFIEIEGKSEADVKAAANALEFDWNAACHGSVENIYQEIYDVTEYEIDNCPEIVFVPVPEWLRVKRRR